MLTHPDWPEASADLHKLLCRHLIVLSWLDIKAKPNPEADEFNGHDPKAFGVSAFVVSVKHLWFLVTAGHILRDLDQRLRAGRRIVKSRLSDDLASEKSLPPIPFTLGDAPQWYVSGDGLDYALIPLSPGFVSQLIAGGVCPLSEESWTNIPEQADGYYLLGFPAQAADISISSYGNGGNVLLSLGTPLLPITPVADPPDELKRRAKRFYARVPIAEGNINGKAITLTDIEGMSGGPIIAIQHTNDGGLRYWVVAVQSGWLRESRVLAACPIRPLLSLMEKQITANARKIVDHESK